MREWTRNHLPEAFLIPSAVSALAVTALSDIPEAVPWGREFGIGLSSISFAYIGAYIFNWLMIEVPRGKALRGYYAAVWGNLQTLLFLPATMVTQISGAVDPEKYVWSADTKELRRFLQAIDWDNKAATAEYDAIDGLIQSAKEHKQAYEAIVPILSSLEPQVAIAVSNLNASPIFDNITHLDRTRFRIIEDSVQSGLSQHLNDYQLRARRLKVALTQSKFTPAFEDDAITPVMDYPNAVED